MVKVSVIIPVYNAGKFLKECLDSVLSQTLDDLEIICVNDGSTDNSLNILEFYANQDTKIKIVSQDNNGQGSARNKGLALAKGEYIYFMDSDDKIKKNTLQDCYDVAKIDNLDFVMFQLINYNDDTDEYYQDGHYDMPKLCNTVEDKIFSYKDLDDLIFNIAVSPVNKLYDKKFLDSINAKFPEDVIFEDNIFFWKMFLNAERIEFIQKHYYIRRRHSFSTTGNANIRFIDTLKIHNRIFDIFKEFKLFDKFESNLFNRKISLVNVRFNQVNDEVKQLFFDEMKNDFEMMIDEYGYEKILILLNKKNKYIFNSVIKSRGYKEHLLSIKNYELESKIKDSASKNKLLKKEIKSLKNENKLILSSTSWKFTKPLRFFRNIFK